MLFIFKLLQYITDTPKKKNCCLNTNISRANFNLTIDTTINCDSCVLLLWQPHWVDCSTCSLSVLSSTGMDQLHFLDQYGWIIFSWAVMSCLYFSIQVRVAFIFMGWNEWPLYSSIGIAGLLFYWLAYSYINVNLF